jgi:hypothetical protein
MEGLHFVPWHLTPTPFSQFWEKGEFFVRIALTGV